MADTAKDDLHRYLRQSRGALLWKLDGISDYDVRRPVTATGTNLLGLVKHTASVGAGYLCDTFGRPFASTRSWLDSDADPNEDMYAAAHESRADVLAFWDEAWAASDETVASLSLDSTGEVPWWPAERRQVTLHRVLVHLIDEVARHAGHADIVRELIDDQVGLRAERSNVPDGDAQWWADYRERLEAIARESL